MPSAEPFRRINCFMRFKRWRFGRLPFGRVTGGSTIRDFGDEQMFHPLCTPVANDDCIVSTKIKGLRLSFRNCGA